jgi:hypothetical protein
MPQDGLVGRLAVWITVGLAFLSLLGGVYSLGQSVSTVNDKLDRNCRIIAAEFDQLTAEVSFLIFQHDDPNVGRRLRKIFGSQASSDSC